MTCNVQQYLPPDDMPVKAVEDLVHCPMRALPVRQRRRARSFMPPSPVELLVLTEAGEQLNLIGYRKKGEEFISELHQADTKLRALHTHEGHSNPDPQRTPVDGVHMHFPSSKRPFLYKHGTYAYPIDADSGGFSDTSDCVLFFCDELRIDVDALQLQLARGGRP